MNQSIHLLDVEHTETSSPRSREEEIKQIIEALLFTSSEPLSLQKIREIVGESFSVNSRELIAYIDSINKSYYKEGRPFQIDDIADGYLMRTISEMAPHVEKLHASKRGEKLSPAATEVLAIVAYRAPITRPEIDTLRGVDCSGTLSSLIERGLVESVGRKEAPGRPMQYATTKKFLKHFGLKDVNELSLTL